MGEEHREDRPRLFTESPVTGQAAAAKSWTNEILIRYTEKCFPCTGGQILERLQDFLLWRFQNWNDQTDGWCNGDHGISLNVGRTDVNLLLCLDTVWIHATSDFHKVY